MLNSNHLTYYYYDTLLSKNKLKKFIFLKFLLKQRNLSNFPLQIVVSLNNQHTKHKNVFLNSPFHFKIVKTHLYIPTFYYKITIHHQIVLSQIHYQRFVNLNHFFLNPIFVGTYWYTQNQRVALFQL